MGQYVSFLIEEHVGVLTLNRPPVNAFCEEIRLEMAEIFDSLNSRTDVWAVILRTEGPGFSGGQDLEEMRSADAELRKRIAPTISKLTTALYNCRVPVIAAVHGFVVGLGLALASLCDVILATEDARFLFPEVKVGTVGGPFWFKRIVPDKLARYYFYTGKPMPALEMYRIGAVLKILPDKETLDEAAMEVAREFAAMYPPALWASKQVITEGEKEVQDVVDISDRMRYKGNVVLLAGDPNKGEMVRAQLEHRKPVYDLSVFEKK